MPDWTQGTWLSIGTSDSNSNTFHINETQLLMKMNDERLIKYDLRFLRIIQSKREHENSIRIRAKSLEQW